MLISGMYSLSFGALTCFTTQRDHLSYSVVLLLVSALWGPLNNSVSNLVKLK